MLAKVAVLATRHWYEGDRDPEGEVRAVCDSHEELRAEVERLTRERDEARVACWTERKNMADEYAEPYRRAEAERDAAIARAERAEDANRAERAEWSKAWAILLPGCGTTYETHEIVKAAQAIVNERDTAIAIGHAALEECERKALSRCAKMREALADAASSLEVLSSDGSGQAGGYLSDLHQARGYAALRAGVAREALAADGEVR